MSLKSLKGMAIVAALASALAVGAAEAKSAAPS